MKNAANTMNNDVINYLVDYHDQFKSLPTNYIECNETGIAYTAFGSNLSKKIEKAGGLRELLTTFVGRGARAKAKKTIDTVVAQAKTAVKEAKKTSSRKPATVSLKTA